MEKRFKRVFAANPNFKFDQAEMKGVADEIIYACNSPMFDNLIGEEYDMIFEKRIASVMHDFNPDEDVIAYFGDAIIFGMMIMYVSDIFEEFFVARFSTKQNKYLIRRFSHGAFIKDSAQPEPDPRQAFAHQAPALVRR
jgi:hypothetical protein